jgi:hypothetical protein
VRLKRRVRSSTNRSNSTAINAQRVLRSNVMLLSRYTENKLPGKTQLHFGLGN